MTRRPDALVRGGYGTIEAVAHNVAVAEKISGGTVSDTAIRASLRRHKLPDTEDNVAAVRAKLKGD